MEQRSEVLLEMILCRRRGVGSAQARVLSQDLAVELLEITARLDPELVDERTACVLVDTEGLGLASRAIQGEHQMGTKTLPGGMAVDKGLDLADDFGVAAGLEVRVDPLFDHRKPLLLQPCNLGLREGFEFEVGQRRSAPEVERFPHPGCALRSLRRGAGRRNEMTKARQIDLLGLNCQRVSGWFRHEHVCTERLPEL